MRRFISRLFAAVLLAVLLIQGLSFPVQADSVIETTSEAANFNKDDEGLWFPGDSATRSYMVKTTHKKPLTLYFYVEIPEASNLEDVLMMDVEVNGESIYNEPKPISTFKKEHTYTVPASQTETRYDITVSLDTSVTEAYENLDLKANFIWKYAKEEQGSSVTVTEIPRTGDQFPLSILIAVMAASAVGLVCLFLLWKNRKKEDDQ